MAVLEELALSKEFYKCFLSECVYVYGVYLPMDAECMYVCSVYLPMNAEYVCLIYIKNQRSSKFLSVNCKNKQITTKNLYVFYLKSKR